MRGYISRSIPPRSLLNPCTTPYISLAHDPRSLLLRESFSASHAILSSKTSHSSLLSAHVSFTPRNFRVNCNCSCRAIVSVSVSAVKSTSSSSGERRACEGEGRRRSVKRVRKVSSSERWGVKRGMSRNRREWWSNADARAFCVVINLQISVQIRKRP
jgi:hypothetical protein